MNRGVHILSGEALLNRKLNNICLWRISRNRLSNETASDEVVRIRRAMSFVLGIWKRNDAWKGGICSLGEQPFAGHRRRGMEEERGEG